VNFTKNPVLTALLAINTVVAVSVTAAVIQNRVTSDNAIAARAKGLQTLAQHLKADTCWKSESEQPFKLGDPVDVPGSFDGKLPTGCIYAPKVQQFLQVGYFNGELQVLQVYSRREMRHQLSNKGEK
jgi:hypothetical protein